ncbi:MAG: YceD family protein [Cyanobacteria bacterium P01_D01_bin.14]
MSLQPIYIPHLEKAPHKTRTIVLDDHLKALETLTPVKGQLVVEHRGNFLEVTADANAIMTLTCHRCLQNYNRRVEVDASEFIWLQDTESGSLALEREVSMDELIETLPPQGHFDPAAWLYEQFCLAMPQRQICDPACPGIAPKPAEATLTDARWGALSALKQQLPDD